MLLSDRTIKRALDTKRIVIEPRPADEAIQPASVDLRLSDKLLLFRDPTWREVVDPFDHGSYKDITIRYTMGSDGFRLFPGNFILGCTMEYVRLDDLHAARLEGKSSLGRLGIEIHSTAGFIDPGFCGYPTLEISNNLKYPVLLRPGMLVCQLAIFCLDTNARNIYSGKYQNQPASPQPSAYWKNPLPEGGRISATTDWRCPRCGSAHGVYTSLDNGWKRIPQCVPCGFYDTTTVLGPGWRYYEGG